MTTSSSTADPINSQLHLFIADSAQPVASATKIGQRVLLGALFIDSVLAASAVTAALISGLKADAYFAEGSFITIVSALQIIAVTCVCIAIYQIRLEQEQSWRGGHLVWAFAALGLSVLVFDEAAGLHEWLDVQLHSLLGLQESPWTDRIDDLIVLSYGLGGAALALLYRRELWRLWSIRRLFIFGFVLFLAVVATDLLTNSYSSDSSVLERRSDLALIASLASAFEDTLKLYCQAVLFAAMIAAAVLIKREQPDGQTA